MDKPLAHVEQQGFQGAPPRVIAIRVREMEIKTADHALPAKEAHKDRYVIERCYCRLKDFRRIAMRYDKLARNYFSALCLVAAVAFWL